MYSFMSPVHVVLPLELHATVMLYRINIPDEYVYISEILLLVLH